MGNRLLTLSDMFLEDAKACFWLLPDDKAEQVMWFWLLRWAELKSPEAA